MIKFMGVLFTVSGGIMAGHYFAGKSLVRIHILEEFEQALQFIYGEIEYAAFDIAEIFSSLSLKGRYCNNFWLRMCDRLSERAGYDFYSIWVCELNNSDWTTYLLYEDRLFLEEVGKNTGNLDRQSQLHTLDIFKNRIYGMIEIARSGYKDRARVCHAVGAAAGIFISILLV